MKEQIVKEVWEKSSPEYVKIIDDSDAHKGHLGTKKVGNSHFSLFVVSSAFNSLSLVKRQQLVYGWCKPFFDEGLHALALKTLTVEEWRRKHG